jgi:FtsP/CotA-like multicopper oxidase with cupredoxin domain
MIYRRLRSLAIAVSAAIVTFVGAAGVARAQYVACPAPIDLAKESGRIPEIVSDGAGRLRGTIILRDAQESLPASAGNCVLQWMRFYQKMEPAGKPSPDAVLAPMPGPTLRAQLGDIVELTFVNQIDPLDYQKSIDEAENGLTTGCDQTSTGYPMLGEKKEVTEEFPDCFHSSSTGNLHFHGTHTNPNATGDNVFIGVRPSPRTASAPGQPSQPLITDTTYQAEFKDLFDRCEQKLRANNRVQWPVNWTDDMPASWANYVKDQTRLLNAYDNGTEPFSPPAKPYSQKLWPVNQLQIDKKKWPQYYVGASANCFLLPNFPGKATPALKMGQAPGTHWYHAHKHGSTALDISNGMAGAFVIESPDYDGALTALYGTSAADTAVLYGWTRRQPVMVVNQLGGTPNLMRGGGPVPEFSVNGEQVPNLTMQPGEIKLWRIVNASPISGFYLRGLPADFDWRQTAQDGVQFDNANYQSRAKHPVYVAPGNRIDLLVQAPAKPGTYPVNVQRGPSVSNVLGITRTKPVPPSPLLNVVVAGTPITGQNHGIVPEMILDLPPTNPRPPSQAFLKDIDDNEIKNPDGSINAKTLVFNSASVVVDKKPDPSTKQHTIGTKLPPYYNGAKFDLPPPGEKEPLSINIGKVDTAEEWTIYNTTTEGGGIDHPFHIHINPFQVTEVFSPNAPLVDTAGQPVVDKTGSFSRLFVISATEPTLEDGQCWLNPNDKSTWKPCTAPKPKSPSGTAPAATNIWWDVFPIPAAALSDTTVIPGYFKMRSRFADYEGDFVLHCHILAHEDRGMMMMVSVGPQREAGEIYQHH